MKKHLPNLFTCLNLFTGCIAVVMIFRDHFNWAAYLIFIAAFFDLLDGMTARKLNLFSSFGKELDSLADMISFGFVPGAIMFKLFQRSDYISWPLPDNLLRIVQFVPFVLTVFSALRLAKFNLDSRQTSSFIGLPTPANTLLVVSFPMILLHCDSSIGLLFVNPVFLLCITALLSFLLISEIPLFALKFKNLSFRENFYQYVLLFSSAILLPILTWLAIPVIFALYFALSFLKSMAAPGSKLQ
ncbi:MAG: CDP-diacylglycerol--serine O-phosphatidyltransferase [Bacteroidetes bacterium]|nr:MAG: CDP-diacylglycerol--serine O-phosphatidyltransferase [Bacteroidota bacterium]